MNVFYVYWRSWSKTFFLNEWTHFLKQRYYSFLYVSLQPHIFIFVRRIAKWCIFNSFKLWLYCPIFVYYHFVILVWKILCFSNIRKQNKHYNKWIFWMIQDFSCWSMLEKWKLMNKVHLLWFRFYSYSNFMCRNFYTIN